MLFLELLLAQWSDEYLWICLYIVFCVHASTDQWVRIRVGNDPFCFICIFFFFFWWCSITDPFPIILIIAISSLYFHKTMCMFENDFWLGNLETLLVKQTHLDVLRLPCVAPKRKVCSYCDMTFQALRMSKRCWSNKLNIFRSTNKKIRYYASISENLSSILDILL